MQEEVVRIPLNDGHAVYGRLREQPGAPLAIVIHGLGGNMNEALHYNFARYLDNEGLSSLRINLYGDEDDARKLRDCTTSMHARDVDEVIRHVRANSEQKIAVVGHSLGGLTALLMHECVDSVVLLDPTTTNVLGVLPNLEYVEALDAYRWSLRLDFILSREMVEELQSLDGDALIRQLQSPVMIISADDPGRPELMRRYYDSASEPKEFAVIPGSDHPFTLGDTSHEVYREATAWIRRFMSPTSLETVTKETSPPEKPNLEGLESKWAGVWERDGIYRFDRNKTRDEVYSIDTPPPTVSGSLHVGHVFSYTHTDTLARYWRMRGKEVFYPMGWDDNGLPTERRVQNYYGVTCDPSLPYDPDFVAPEPLKKKGERAPIALSRQNFIELCETLTVEDEKAFQDLWTHLGLSVDWSRTYTTIGKDAQRVSQRMFLRNLRRGLAYQAEAPTMWDVDFQSAVAQAEMDDREIPGAYHRITFHAGSEIIEVDTTRPELLPACVAVIVHPDDARYKHLHGQTLTTPVFGARVVVHPHELADPEKGTGAVMCCTFGDLTDILWWRQFDLPTRTIVQRNGRIGALDWQHIPCVNAESAQVLFDQLVGLKIKPAQEKMVELLRKYNEMIGDPRPITHPVKFYEKGDRPLEIVSSRQWFISTMAHANEFIERGNELDWHPPYMFSRFESWVQGLNTDWLISRQRFFGVPFPVWYALDHDGNPDYESPILADEELLPVDPSSSAPPGYVESQRGQPNGFVGDPDVMDTWATSSLTPQLATGWFDDEDLHARTYPMDVRPQAHEIIRTWLFSTVVRAQFETGALPWKHAAISGWILDPDRKKMSKSQGNVVTPSHLLDEFGSDAVRYWAASGRPGADTAFDTNQMKVGRRLAIKLLNASKFVLTFDAPAEGTSPAHAVDKSLLGRLDALIRDATAAFEGYDYARALDKTESFFWSFCDDYLELVKGRAYGAQGPEAAASASFTLRYALSSMQRLFAPFLPFVAEEVWSWWQEGSIHRASWPIPYFESEYTADALEPVSFALSEVRRAKSEAKVSQRAGISRCVVTDTAENIVHIRSAEADLKEAGSIAELVLEEGDRAVTAELATND